jgi:hypothetical protein
MMDAAGADLPPRTSKGAVGTLLFQETKKLKYSIRKFAAAGIVVAAVSFAANLPAHADITFTLGNNPQQQMGEENVLLNNGTTGSMVFGETNMSSTLVKFSSMIDTLTEPSNGQARVEASDGAVNDITITVPDGTYTDLIFNPFIGGAHKAAGGATKVTVVANDGTFTFPGMGESYDLTNGSNFLTIVATNNEYIKSTTIDSDGGFNDLRQIRISGISGGDVVPEPCTLALLGTGALPMLGVLRRRRKS